jgi:hypothetical protein
VKDLTYLQDKNTSIEQSKVAVVESKPYRLQVNDILKINIKAIDPRLVSIFNTTENNVDAVNLNHHCILMVLRLMIMGISECLYWEKLM